MAIEQLRLPEPGERADVCRTPPLLTIRDTAAFLSVGRTTVYGLIAGDELETVHIGR